jgi:hypothetical protein
MAYYDALIAKWPSITGADTATKLAALNAQTVAGPNVDVPAHAVVGTLMLSGSYLTLAKFAQGSFSGNTTHDNALGAAMMLMSIIGTPNAPQFKMSDPATYAQVKALMDAILAQETATPGSTGFTQAVHDSLLALASTSQPWWQANGYRRAFNTGDIVVAGLDATTGYSFTLGVPTTNNLNVLLSVTVTGPKTIETVNTFASTLDADYSKYFAANCIENMILRDTSLATF